MCVYMPTLFGISFDIFVLHDKKMAYVFSDSLSSCIHLRISYYQCNKSHPSMQISTRIYIHTCLDFEINQFQTKIDLELSFKLS